MSIPLRPFVERAQVYVQQFFRALGYNITKIREDFSAEDKEIYEKVRPYTATSIERVTCLREAVKYLTRNKIEGDFVECGVWRGGSMMAAMLTLVQAGDTARHFYLFDTYEGMPPPTSKDVTTDGKRAVDLLDAYEKKEGHNYWCIASLEDVKNNVYSTGYPPEKIHFIKGRVEETLPMQAPKNIALLRLDTDWYESTKHELTHLYPNLRQHGVLIFDDYGFWQGSRQAADEYLGGLKLAPLLNKMDASGRIAVKSA